MERRHYIDNLRWMAVLFLFVYHACMVWNDFGEGFYVWAGGNGILTYVITFCYPIYMPLLFCLAGISTKYALRKRSYSAYFKERFLRLGLPFLTGILLLVPVQTYYAEVFHNGYTGSYWQQYALFFTKNTDFTGYKGGFTLAHLWFILFLLIISIVGLFIIGINEKIGFNKRIGKSDFNFILAIVVPILLLWLTAPMLEHMAGKSIVKYLVCFLLGYYLMADDRIVNVCKDYWSLMGSMYLVLNIFHLIMFSFYGFTRGSLYNLLSVSVSWLGILSAIGVGKRWLNFANKLTLYFTKASYPYYLLHQTVLVVVAYFVLTYLRGVALQFTLIVVVSFLLTALLYEIVCRIPHLRTLFGIK